MRWRLFMLGGAVLACQADPLDLSGRACGPGGRCLDGWVCDQARDLCVRPGELDAATDAAGGTASDAAPGDSASGGAGGSFDGGGAGGGSATGGATDGGTGAVGGSGGLDPDGGAGAPSCSATQLDCDGNAANGCETDTSSSSEHCGACGRACSGAHVMGLACQGGVCTSSCALGFANCSTPVAPQPDDGCELDATGAQACGGCGVDCAAAGSAGGLACDATSAPVCSCDGLDSKCGSGGKCTVSGICSCGTVTCRPGESCSKSGATVQCECGGGAPCGATEACCPSLGCRDLASAPTSCGACGRACPSGFVCVGGECSCDQAADCDGGSTGSCQSGRCHCGGATCASGQRCLAAGGCG